MNTYIDHASYRGQNIGSFVLILARRIQLVRAFGIAPSLGNVGNSCRGFFMLVLYRGHIRVLREWCVTIITEPGVIYSVRASSFVFGSSAFLPANASISSAAES